MSLTQKSSTIKYNSGKFKLEVTYDYTDNALLFTGKINVTDTCKSSHKFYLKWTDEQGNYVTPISTAARKKDYTFAQKTVASREVTVAAKIGSSKWATVKIVAGASGPTSIEAEKIDDSRYLLTVEGISASANNKKTQSVTIERAVNTQSSWTAIGSAIPVVLDGLSYTVQAYDTETEAGNVYWWRAKATNAIGGDSDYVYTAEGEYTNPVTTETTINSVTRNNNNSCTIEWSLSSVAPVSRGIITSFAILKSTNGGAYTPIYSKVATTSTTQYSYTDTGCSSDNSYKYGIQVMGSGGTSYAKILDSTEITMSPSSPSSVTISRNSSDYVVVKILGNSNTATNVCIERNIDGGGWDSVAEEDYPCSSYIDENATASDNIIYRVRYKNSALSGTDMYSSYTQSNVIQSKSKPAKPDLVSPVSGANIALTDGSVRLVWRHNSTDGSSQEAATIYYKINNGNWMTKTETVNSYTTLSLVSGYSANDVVSWKVITKGAHSDYSDESNVYTFNILTKPQITFTEPDNGDVIDTLPIVLEWNYSDACGTLAQLMVDIVQNNKVVQSYNVPTGSGASGTYTFSLAGFLFENNTVYGLRTTALSSSGLSATDNISITVQYEPVQLSGGLLPAVTSNSETGIAQISVMRDKTPVEGVTPSPITISNCYLYRKHDGERTLVASNITEGSFFTDKYAPINVDYEYELVMLTALGQISIVTVSVNNPSSYWFVYWGDNIARAEWNPEGSVKLSRPQKTQVRYSGRKYPVSYDSDAIEETFSFSADIDDRAELNNFKQMMRDGGTGIWKSGDGDVYDADFDFSYSVDYTECARIWKSSLDVTRIEGDNND